MIIAVYHKVDFFNMSADKPAQFTRFILFTKDTYQLASYVFIQLGVRSPLVQL